MSKMLKSRKVLAFLVLALFSFSTLYLAGCGSSAESPVNWTLVNPQGVVEAKTIKPNPHPSTLEGKTVVLRWNGKENGNNFLDEVAVQLQQTVKSVNVIKVYETMPETVGYGPAKMGPEVIAKIKALKPDLVISSQAD